MFDPAIVAERFVAFPGLAVFSVVRNEAPRLPGWLRHYRALGATSFFVVDNGSTDGGDRLLEAQEDVVLVRTQASYGQSNYGVDWLNQFHDQAPPGRWILYADADELLVHRGWPTRPLADVLAAAERHGCGAIFAYMLDMYPDGPVEDATPPDDGDLFRASPCFDSDYVFRLRPRRPWEKRPDVLEVLGGPRLRLLSSLRREAATTWVDYWLRGQLDRILPVTPRRLAPLVVRLAPRQLPCLSKMPLALSGSGFRYDNAHGGFGAKVHRETMILCHFKFLADFAARVRTEVARGEHFRGGAEYMLYAQALERHGRLDLRYEGTAHFSGAEQLERMGLFARLPAPAADGPVMDAPGLDAALSA